jgi:chaperone modulatory protein CbpM
LAQLARIRRLRAGLQVNYAGLGVVIDLLDRIQRLEDALRKQRPVRSQPWT